MAGVYTDLQGFGDMKIAAREKTPEAIRAVASQFEALFVQTMLKSMRDATPGTGLFDSSQTRMYQDLYDKQISLDLAGKGEFGFTELLVRQLGGDSAAVDITRPANGFPFNPAADGRVFQGVVRQPRLETVQNRPLLESTESIEQDPEQTFSNQQVFLRELYPHAQQAAEKLGVRPEVLLAQAALETGWGRHVMPSANGNSSHNLFGIKAGQDWQGQRVAVSSLEYEGGVARKQISAFRAYDSYAESFADYADFIQSRARYQTALQQAGNDRAYVKGLQQAGYATDPRYAEKIMSILQRLDSTHLANTGQGDAAGRHRDEG